MLKQSITTQAKAAAEAYKPIRRQIHAFPELSFEEVETTRLVREALMALGITIQELSVETGILGIIRGEKPGRGPTILLRADMDALPVQENTGLPYASRRENIAHACGHDGHVAMLLGAASLLQNNREAFSGVVKLLFQPGEEKGEGARRMIEAGALEAPPVDCALALHAWPYCSIGQLGVYEGAYMASSDVFEVEIQGEGGHGAYPHMLADSIQCAAAMVQALNTIISRKIDALEHAVLSIGTLHAGTAANIMPASARLSGTVRAQTPAVREKVEALIRSTCQGVAATFGCKVQIHYAHGPMPLYNSPGVVAQARESYGNLFGENTIVELPTSAMSSEDFSQILSQVPEGAFLRLGVTPPGERAHKLHSDTFAFDDDALLYGIALLTQFVLDKNRV